MPTDDKPIISLTALLPDLYLLLAVLMADTNIAAVRGTDWTQDLFETEVRRRILWVATAVRSLLDLLRSKGATREAKIFDRDIDNEVCGEYWYYYDQEKTRRPQMSAEQPLSLRQACNSLIHARVILPYLDEGIDAPAKTCREVYRDRITVRAVHGKRSTRAQLDVIKFVQLAITLANLFEEDNDADV